MHLRRYLLLLYSKHLQRYLLLLYTLHLQSNPSQHPFKGTTSKKEGYKPEFARVRVREMDSVPVVQVFNVEHVRVVQLLDLSSQPDLLRSVPYSAHLNAWYW